MWIWKLSYFSEIDIYFIDFCCLLAERSQCLPTNKQIWNWLSKKKEKPIRQQWPTHATPSVTMTTFEASIICFYRIQTPTTNTISLSLLNILRPSLQETLLIPPSLQISSLFKTHFTKNTVKLPSTTCFSLNRVARLRQSRKYCLKPPQGLFPFQFQIFQPISIINFPKLLNL